MEGVSRKKISRNANYCKKTLDILEICYYNKYAVSVTLLSPTEILFFYSLRGEIPKW